MDTLVFEESYYKNFNDYQIKQIREAIKWIEKIINDDFTRGFISNFKRPDGEIQFAQTEYLNEEVYRRFYGGSERGSGEDNIYQVRIKGYYKKWSTAVARTFPSDKSGEIQINKAKYNFSDIPGLANTIVHEYCHLVGLKHSWDWVPLRDYSGPYVIGWYFERRIDYLMKNPNQQYLVKWNYHPDHIIPKRRRRRSLWSRTRRFFNRLF